jgi:hypothetical protein
LPPIARPRPGSHAKRGCIRTIRPTSVACALSLLFLVGCRDGSKEAAPTEAPAAPAAAGSPVDTAFTGQGSATFCNLAKSYNVQSTKVGATGSPAEVRTAVQESKTAINQAVGAAPPEIRADVQVIATAFTGLADAFEKGNYEPAKVDLTSLQKFQTPQFQASSDRFQAYLRNVCKVTG